MSKRSVLNRFLPVSTLIAALLAVGAVPRAAQALSMGEIGNGKKIPPARPSDAMMAPAQKQAEETPAWVAAPGAVVREGDTFSFQAWVESHDPLGSEAEVEACRAWLVSDSLEWSRVWIDHCRVERIASGQYRISFSHRFDKPTVARAYRLGGVEWENQGSEDGARAVSSFSDHLIVVDGSVSSSRMPIGFGLSTQDACRDRGFLARLDLSGTQALVAAALELEVDQGTGSLESGFFPILPEGADGDWILGSTWVPRTGWSSLETELRVPSDYPDVRWLAVRRLILLDRELREMAVETKAWTRVSSCH